MICKNPNQIILIHGKNVFMEVLNSAFNIEKVRINFIEYKKSQTGTNIKKNINVYIDMDKFLELSEDILSGKMADLAKQEKEISGKEIYKEIYSEAQFAIAPGRIYPWRITGKADINSITTEEIVKITITDEDFKEFAQTVRDSILSYKSNQATLEEVKQKNIKELREDFLDHVKNMVNYWNNIDNLDQKERLNGVAFSILTAIDGCAGGLPSFILTPTDNPECDIAGGLHEHFYK
ncbi:MAG: hypothetical protein K0R54_816 [Clostridiaceae bacterium]|jgi:hypothetical protein|nr:hypothetical protein [Clostridiaceae bacterium]